MLVAGFHTELNRVNCLPPPQDPNLVQSLNGYTAVQALNTTYSVPAQRIRTGTWIVYMRLLSSSNQPACTGTWHRHFTLCTM
jgi:hypothetical protein